MASLEQPTRCQVARSRNTLSGGTQRAVHHAVDGGKVEQGCGSSGEGKCATLGGWCHGREGTHALASAASGQPRLRFGMMTRPASRLRALPEILCPPAMVTRVWKICNQVAERQRGPCSAERPLLCGQRYERQRRVCACGRARRVGSKLIASHSARFHAHCACRCWYARHALCRAVEPDRSCRAANPRLPCCTTKPPLANYE